MTNHKEIIRLKHLGLSYPQIAVSCQCSISTANRTVNKLTTSGMEWESIKGWTPEQVTNYLFPKLTGDDQYKMPDYLQIHQEMAKPGVTLALLWNEYYQQCRLTGETPYKLTQFKKYYRDYLQKTKATMHIEHKRGEIMEVDWAGTTLSLQNSLNGSKEKVFIFVAVLPYSGYTYAEGFLSMNQESWIIGHINAYQFFGGVTRILVPDNLKTGVTKNTKEELLLNPTYQELGEHYGTAIIPARPRAPKDKASVEGVVGNITTAVIAPLRNQQYFSLFEINEDISRYLHEFNNKPFQKKEGSRTSLFEEERACLLSLPVLPYEMAVWKIATVQYNYHITVDSHHYSCPYEYIHKKVDVRITPRIVEIYYNGTRIASHIRLSEGDGAYSTAIEHMPQNHQQYALWDGDRFRKWAGRIGESTLTVVDTFLTSPKVEQQGYKSCMAFLKLTETYSQLQLEGACRYVLTHTHHPSLKGIKAVLASGRFTDKNDVEVGVKQSPHGFVRGPAYYKRGDE